MTSHMSNIRVVKLKKEVSFTAGSRTAYRDAANISTDRDDPMRS